MTGHDIELVRGQWVAISLPTGEVVRVTLRDIQRRRQRPPRASLGVIAPRHIEVMRDDAQRLQPKVEHGKKT